MYICVAMLLEGWQERKEKQEEKHGEWGKKKGMKKRK